MDLRASVFSLETGFKDEHRKDVDVAFLPVHRLFFLFFVLFFVSNLMWCLKCSSMPENRVLNKNVCSLSFSGARFWSFAGMP